MGLIAEAFQIDLGQIDSYGPDIKSKLKAAFIQHEIETEDMLLDEATLVQPPIQTETVVVTADPVNIEPTDQDPPITIEDRDPPRDNEVGWPVPPS